MYVPFLHEFAVLFWSDHHMVLVQIIIYLSRHSWNIPISQNKYKLSTNGLNSKHNSYIATSAMFQQLRGPPGHRDAAKRHGASVVVDVIMLVVGMLWLYHPDFFHQCFNSWPAGSTEVTSLLSSAVLHLKTIKTLFQRCLTENIELVVIAIWLWRNGLFILKDDWIELIILIHKSTHGLNQTVQSNPDWTFGWCQVLGVDWKWFIDWFLAQETCPRF